MDDGEKKEEWKWKKIGEELERERKSMQKTWRSRSRSSESRGGGGEGEGEGEGEDEGKWAGKVLRECAKAISERDSKKTQHLMWMLNEVATPYGEGEQKVAWYFLQALFCRATQSGERCYKTLTAVGRKNESFEAARSLILKFQEVSPWTTFGHVASNGAILEAFEGEGKLHIIDVSNTLCTQWPTLLEALATRNDETPQLKLSVLALPLPVPSSLIKEVGQRMEKFARLMGVPFQFNVISAFSQITKEALGLQDDEAIAVNCVGAFRRVQVQERDNLILSFKSLSPKVVTVVEEEADFSISTQEDFLKCFHECLKFYTLYFEMLEESFPPTSNERLMLERECSRSIIRVLACCGGDCCEIRERGVQWSQRLTNAPFSPTPFSDDVLDDVKALLKRYQPGYWSLLLSPPSGIYLTWKDQPVVWASAWKP